ncbi:MAG: hypothetical protein QF419_04390 [Acidimicrobiales bacterium]|nr:hypothetical protein [Acidimicrobiales bacterium]
MPDLRFGTTIPTSEEVAAVEEVVVGAGPATVNISERLVLGGRSRAVARRNLLLPSLHALQRAVGWISPGGLDHVCRVLEISPAMPMAWRPSTTCSTTVNLWPTPPSMFAMTLSAAALERPI